VIGGFIEVAPSGKMIRAGWERISAYLPVILMGFIALGTYWLARNSPIAGPGQTQVTPTHEPDSFMRRFWVRSFDASGRMKSELHGVEARHYPDTDTFEIDEPQLRSIGADGDVTRATAKRAISNADGSEVILNGDAHVTRDAAPEPTGRAPPQLAIRGETLHVYLNTERVTSSKPVELMRGSDRLEGDSMTFDNVTQVLELHGRVKAQVRPQGAAPP
jgi:lipopolysaccharide export system protein LptC